jgi:hypothetical protein
MAGEKIHWNDAQQSELTAAKQEFKTFLVGINYVKGEKRDEPRSEDGQTVKTVRDRLVERLMALTDDSGQPLFHASIQSV